MRCNKGSIQDFRAAMTDVYFAERSISLIQQCWLLCKVKMFDLLLMAPKCM